MDFVSRTSWIFHTVLRWNMHAIPPESEAEVLQLMKGVFLPGVLSLGFEKRVAIHGLLGHFAMRRGDAAAAANAAKHLLAATLEDESLVFDIGTMVALARLAPYLAGASDGGAMHAAALAIVARSPVIAPGIFGIKIDGSLLDSDDVDV